MQQNQYEQFDLFDDGLNSIDSDSNTSVEDDASTDSTVAAVQYDISSYGADYDVEGIVKRLSRGDIKIPEFQRQYVWNQKEASRFIESLLLGLPVPGVFFAKEQNTNKLLVIDGQQRLKTLLFFYEGVFNPQKGDSRLRIFTLEGVQKQFDGAKYQTLEEKDRIRLNDSLIHATIIKQESPQNDNTSIYHIFDRLNSYGRRLTPQEIRTAVFEGKLINLIKKLNEHNNWRQIFGKKSVRMKDQELILRFLALRFPHSQYERPINEYLNKFTEYYRDLDEEMQERFANTFIKTIDLVNQYIGRTAFRPISSINAAVFDSIMVGLSLRLESGEQLDGLKVSQAYEMLLKDEEYTRLISQSTSDETNVKERLKKTTNAFSSI